MQFIDEFEVGLVVSALKGTDGSTNSFRGDGRSACTARGSGGGRATDGVGGDRIKRGGAGGR